MKRSWLALSVLTTFAGLASAQSSVTLFGVVDASLRGVKTGSTSLKMNGTDGNNPSRLGVRGTEHLGSGLYATFWLEGALRADTGATNSKLFNRRATVGLAGTLGEARVGRDTLAVWNNQVQFDVFGATGVAQISNLVGVLATTVTPSGGVLVAADNKRADNQVAYYLPGGLDGVYGQWQYAFGEGGKGRANGGRLGFKAFGFDGAVAFNHIDVNEGNYRIVDVAASYDVTLAKIVGQFIQIKLDPMAAGAETKQTVWQLGASVPVSAAVAVKTSYAKASNFAQATQLAVGYQHEMSKRTALYVTYAQIKNKNANAAFMVSDAPAAAGLLQKSSGYEFGMRHNF